VGAGPAADDCKCGHPRWVSVRAAKWVGHFQAGSGACRHPGCSCRKYRHHKTGKGAMIGLPRSHGGRLRHVSMPVDDKGEV
jgi:hypothetical protein